MKRLALSSLLLLLFVSACINDRRLAERIPPLSTSDLLLDQNKLDQALQGKLTHELFSYSQRQLEQKAISEVEFVGVRLDPQSAFGGRDSSALQSVTRYINEAAAEYFVKLCAEYQRRPCKSKEREDSLWNYQSAYADIWYLYCDKGVSFYCKFYAQYDEFDVWFTSSSGTSYKSLTEDDIKTLVRAIDEHIGKTLSASRIEYRVTITWEPRQTPTPISHPTQTASP